ncbi:putative arginine repressor ArgR [Streptococcus sp. DD12]|nr:putative arginine repressor ArgR [Streptococcus sp. DD12]
MIRELIENENFSKQGDLVKALQARGCHATQATISRDMDEMGIVKVPIGNGYRYSLAKPKAPAHTEDKQATALVTVLNVTDKHTTLPCLLSVDVVPGTSRLVKRRLLDEESDAIFSILTDDETLLVVANTPEQASQLRTILLSWKEA